LRLWIKTVAKRQGTPAGFPHAFGAAPPPATRPLGAAKLIHKSKKTSKHKPAKVYSLKWFLARLSDALSWQAITDLRPNKSSDTGKSMVNWNGDLLTNVPDRLGCVF
jgi:hypothetical protein